MMFNEIKRRKIEDQRLKITEAELTLGPSSSAEDKFLNASATEIAGRIRSGDWTATQVVSAFSKQAIKVNKSLNFITEPLFISALERAQELDIRAQKYGKLYGVPVSVKDTFNISGIDSSLGLSKFCNLPACENATIVNILLAEGAVILFKTNVPQTLLTNESSNPIFGKTLNPTPGKQGYTCGGSSGGEAVSLATNSAALGFGSDIAGSLRFPVAFSGRTYSLKPSESRIPAKGHFGIVRGKEGIQAVVGPMARSVADLRLLTRTILEAQPWTLDATCRKLPYSPSIENKDEDVNAKKSKLRFAYYVDDTFTISSPAVVRTMSHTIARLESAGHECIPITPPRVTHAVRIFTALNSSDAYQPLRDALGSDPRESNVAMTMVLPRIWRSIRYSLAWILSTVFGDEKSALLLRMAGRRSIDSYSEWVWQRNELRQYWLDHVWNYPSSSAFSTTSPIPSSLVSLEPSPPTSSSLVKSTGSKAVNELEETAPSERRRRFDAILAPVYPIPAPKHGETRTILPIAASTFLYNVLDYTVGCLCIGHVSAHDTLDSLDAPLFQSEAFEGKGIDKKRSEKDMRGDERRRSDEYRGWRGLFHASLYTGLGVLGWRTPPIYNPLEMAGLPIGMQVVGYTLEEEKVLDIMDLIDTAIRL